MTHEKMPEALRLADALDGEWTQVWHMVAGAKELRRQHAEIERLWHIIASGIDTTVKPYLQSTKEQT